MQEIIARASRNEIYAPIGALLKEMHMPWDVQFP